MPASRFVGGGLFVVRPGAGMHEETLGSERGRLSTAVENGGTLPKKGAVCVQWKRCGHRSCRCARGQLHGPYYCLFWREDGRRRKRYVRQADVEATRATTVEWRRLHPPVWTARQAVAELGRLFRELDALGT